MTWSKIPAAIKVELTGKLRPFVFGKDVILHLIGVEGARYKSPEFVGDGVATLEMDDRFTICNMTIEAGAKNGIFPVDEKCLAYVNQRVNRPLAIFEADADAEYESTIVMQSTSVSPSLNVQRQQQKSNLVIL